MGQILGIAADDGVALIAAERRRQVYKENYGTDHDDLHKGGELVLAAVCYAMSDINAIVRGRSVRLTIAEDGLPPAWPWEPKDWKPSPDDRIRELVKAGALIAAEIDRLKRAAGG